MGTGSGIIAICLAKHLPTCRVTAIDISPAALAVAKDNAQQHGVAERIEFVESDLFAAVPAERKFDFIVSNPPYVTAAELDGLAPDVRKFEPRVALLAGPRGTEVIERLVAQSADRLLPGGHLLHGNQPDDSRRGAHAVGIRRPFRTRPDDQGPRPAAARGAGAKKGLACRSSTAHENRFVPGRLPCAIVYS